jgi:hypothetical protein
LDAADGSPTDVVYVESDGAVWIGSPTTMDFGAKLAVHEQDGRAAEFTGRNADILFIVHNEDSGAQSNPMTAYLGVGGTSSTVWPTYPTALVAEATGYAEPNAGAALMASRGSSATLAAQNIDGTGAALYTTIAGTGTGYTAHFDGGDGVLIERDSSYPALDIDNLTTGAAADAVWISAPNGAASNTWALYSYCYQGEAARFSKYVDDGQYTAKVLGNTVSSMGLYVQGTFVYTGAAARSVETSRGREAVYAVNAPDAEVVASGTARLVGGQARVEFDRLFVEAIDGAADIRVTATPNGAWSALYTAAIDERGFEVRSGAGSADVEFHWMAIGRAADWETSRSLVLPDPAEDARLAEEKEARNVERHSRHPAPPVIQASR